MAAALRACLVLALCLGVSGLKATGANPIRKVVTLMQNMQKEIEAEGAKEQELYDKFMCFCTNNDGSLEKQAADASSKIEELEGTLKSDAAEKSQLEQEVVQHKSDVTAAEGDLSEAVVLREKEAKEFADMKADSEANIKAMEGAIPALEKGMGGASFLQTPDGDRVKRLAETFQFSDDYDRKNALAFFEQSGDYVPQSGQIVGILKGMLDSMSESLKQGTADEDAAIKGFEELKASKTSEINAGKQAVEAKQSRSGELAVSLVTAANDLEDTQKELADVTKLAADLKEQCGTKEKEWAERCKMRNEEIQAISEAINILNDDDALDVFKKAIPASLAQSQVVGFIQRSEAHTASTLRRAQAILAKVAEDAGSHRRSQALKMMFLSLSSKLGSQLRRASRGKVTNFGEVIKMVDGMVDLESKEQANDDKDKPWCNGEFDKKDREEKSENTEITKLEAELEQEDGEIASLVDEVAALKEEIAELDKSVAEATDTRKEEHEDYIESIQLTTTAVELVEKAKNRLNKFYNPVLYKAPPVKKEMTMEEKIIDAGSFLAQIRKASKRARVAPLEAPETFGSYEKKGEKSGGVLALMDMIVKELKNDMQDGEYAEKTAQKDYAKLMEGSQEARAADLKAISDKMAAIASLKDTRLTTKEKEDGDIADLDVIHKYVNELHGTCDFIIENYDVRKEARVQEVEALKNAKSALSGAQI